MTYRLSNFLIVLIFIGCTNKPTGSEQSKLDTESIVQQDTLVKYALQKLSLRLQQGQGAGTSASFKNDQILFGDTIIKLKIKVEYGGQKDGQNIFAANYITTIVEPTGQNTEIENGVIGIGENRAEAFNNCVVDWMNVLGTPLINLLQQSNNLIIDDLKVYAGQMGIRGQVPPGTWLTGDHLMSEKILKGIGQLVKSNKNKIVPVDIKVLVQSGKVVSGECRLGNIVSLELLKKMKALPWPVAKEKFIFSQFYLVVRGE